MPQQSDYIKFTIQSSKVAGDLTDFPVYLDLSQITDTHFWNNVSSDGGELRCYQADQTTELPREIVAIDPGNQTGEVHVQYTGTLPADSNTEIHLFYGDTSLSDYAASDTYGRNNVWTGGNLISVNHVQKDPTTTQPDATGDTAKDLMPQGGFSSSDQATGLLGGNAVDAPGTEDAHFETSTNAWEEIGTSGEVTFEYLFKTSIGAGEYEEIGGADGHIEMKISDNNDHNGHIGGYFKWVDGTWTIESTVAVNDGNWHLAHLTCDGTNTQVFVDGALDNTGTGDLYDMSLDRNGSLAAYYDGGQEFIGLIDEFRLYDGVVSEAWVTTEWNNLYDPGTFYTVSNHRTTTVTASPNDLSHTHSLEAPGILQTHITTPAAIDHGHSMESPAISQIHISDPAALSHTHTLASPSIHQTHIRTPAAIDHAHTLDAPAISQVHISAPEGINHAHTMDAPAISQIHITTPAEITHTHSLDAPAISQTHIASPAALWHGHGLASPAISQVHITTPAALFHNQTLAAPAITQTHIEAPADVSHTHAIESPTIAQIHRETPTDLTHAQTLDSPAIQQVQIVTPADIVHTHGVDSPTVWLTYHATPADLAHVHSLESPVVSFDLLATPADLHHAHTLAAPPIHQVQIVTPADLSHVHSLDAPPIQQTHIAVPADLFHSHALDAIAAYIPGYLIVETFQLEPALDAEDLQLAPRLQTADGIDLTPAVHAANWTLYETTTGTLILIPTLDGEVSIR